MNKKAIIIWTITIIWMIVIFAFSANEGPESISKSKKVTYQVINIVENKKTETEKKNEVEKVHPTVRKIAHAFEYAVLCILLLKPIKYILLLLLFVFYMLLLMKYINYL